MIEREYRLFAKDVGPYEIVPKGFSILALILQFIWAAANGVFLRFICLFVPVLILGMLENSIPAVGSYILMPYIVLAFFVYFPLRAFAWREKVLTDKGFKFISAIRANSSQEALRKYAESVHES